MKTFNLGWGESVAVRKSFLETHKNPIVFSTKTLSELGYPDYAGDPALVELTRKIIKRNIGVDYPYILITNGATGGATIALRSFQLARKFEYCIVRPPPYFRMYPMMVHSAGLKLYHWDTKQNDYPGIQGIVLVDSISNPTCEFSALTRNGSRDPIIWDAVYYGNIYAPGIHPKPEHDVLVGSYSKLTGLNGLRVGWIACHEKKGYELMKSLVMAEYCGISAASTKIILDTAGQFTDEEWTSFEISAKYKLDCNREEFSKLEKFFGGASVSPYGMFYYAQMDYSCKKLFEKSGIVWSPGSQLGTNDDFGRFNVGQDTKLVKKAVETVLKNDKLPK